MQDFFAPTGQIGSRTSGREVCWRRNLAQLAAIRKHFPEALVTGYEPLIEALTLPDPDDRHVLAAAILCGAQQIITENLADFPEDALAPFSGMSEWVLVGREPKEVEVSAEHKGGHPADPDFPA